MQGNFGGLGIGSTSQHRKSKPHTKRGGRFGVLPSLRKNYVENMQTILVTGGAGYIGSICVEQLLNQGYSVAVFDNLTEGHRLAVDPRAGA